MNHHHHNKHYRFQHHHQQPQQSSPLAQKHRAKSVPNLEVDDVPHYITDSRSGVTYAIQELLGRGGFAKCYLACSNRQNFALKVISRESIKEHNKQIHREILIHYNLRHPNIVALYSTFECTQNIYLLLELCPNRTLAEYIEFSQGHCLPESTAIVYMKQLVLAVRYLHDECGLVHRDIKPANVLFSREWNVKLADFGFCCPIQELSKRLVHSICGTPNYVAPEVIDKLGHSTHTDCWSLGCTYYTMLFRRPPFHSDCTTHTYERIRRCQYTIPQQHHNRISEASKDLIRRTLVHRPEQRLGCAQMLVHPALNPRPSFDRSLSLGSSGRHSQHSLTLQFDGNNFSSSINRQQQHQQHPPLPLLVPPPPPPPIPLHQQLLQPTHQQHLYGSSSFNIALGNTTTTGILGVIVPDGMMQKSSGNQHMYFALESTASTATPFTIPSVDTTFGITTLTQQVGGDSGLGFVPGNGSGCEQTLLHDTATGTLARLMQYQLDKYIDVLNSVMDPFSSLDLLPLDTSGDEFSAFPASIIAKWVDYTNKFGFGVSLRDGTRSVLFNDQSTLSSTHSQRHFSYCANKFSGNSLDWSYREGFPNADLCTKVTILQCMRDYMDRELCQSVPIHSVRNNVNFFPARSPAKNCHNDIRSPPYPSPYSRHHHSSSSQPTTPLVHIVDHRKFPDALFMLLSDGTCQVNFTRSHHKLVMCAVQIPKDSSSNGTIVGERHHSIQLHLITNNTTVDVHGNVGDGIYNFLVANSAECNNISDGIDNKFLDEHHNNNNFRQHFGTTNPLADNGWALLRAFRRVLQSYNTADTNNNKNIQTIVTTNIGTNTAAVGNWDRVVCDSINNNGIRQQQQSEMEPQQARLRIPPVFSTYC